MSVKELDSNMLMLRLTALILLHVYRKKLLTPLIIAIVIPVAVALAFQTSSYTLEESIRLAVIHIKDNRVQSECFKIKVENIVIASSDERFETINLVVDNVCRFLKAIDVRRISSCRNKNVTVSIGSMLAKLSNIKQGSVIRVCTPKSLEHCRYVRVDAIHDSRDMLGYILVSSKPLTSNARIKVFCILSRVNTTNELINAVTLSISRLTQLLSIAAMVSYSPLLILACRRIWELMASDIEVLLEIGVSQKILRIAFTLSMILLSFYLTLLGIASSVFVIHLLLTLAKLLGVIIPIRPLPPLTSCILIVCVTSLITSVAAYITSKEVILK